MKSKISFKCDITPLETLESQITQKAEKCCDLMSSGKKIKNKKNENEAQSLLEKGLR